MLTVLLVKKVTNYFSVTLTTQNVTAILVFIKLKNYVRTRSARNVIPILRIKSILRFPTHNRLSEWSEDVFLHPIGSYISINNSPMNPIIVIGMTAEYHMGNPGQFLNRAF